MRQKKCTTRKNVNPFDRSDCGSNTVSTAQFNKLIFIFITVKSESI